jgi:two-component system response regulator
VKNRTILLVEDDPNDECLTLHALKKSRIGNEVYIVRDGVSALDYLFCRNQFADRDPSDLPEFILLDIRLPKLDGIEVLGCIRANKPTHLLPVVILSGANEEQYLLESYQHGANAYLQKPIDFAQFCEVIKRLGLYFLVVNEMPSKEGYSIE